MSERRDSIDDIDKLLWRLRWWPVIPLVLIAAFSSVKWGTLGLLAALMFAAVVAGTLYMIRRPLNIKRLRLLNEDLEGPQDSPGR
jgi:Flp pilus assembly protein TadB